MLKRFVAIGVIFAGASLAWLIMADRRKAHYLSTDSSNAGASLGGKWYPANVNVTFRDRVNDQVSATDDVLSLSFVTRLS